MSGHDCCDYEHRPVTCDRCGVPYQATPETPLVCMPEGDHACPRCAQLGTPSLVMPLEVASP